MDLEPESPEKEGTSNHDHRLNIKTSLVEGDHDRDEDSGIFQDEEVISSDAGSDFNIFSSFEEDEKVSYDNGSDGHFTVIKYEESLFEEVCQMIQQMQSNPSAEHVSFGKSEFQNAEDVQRMLSVSSTFLIRPRLQHQVDYNDGDNDFIGFISITQTKFTRSSCRHFADLIIGLTQQGLNLEGIMEFLIDYGVRFAKDAKFAGVTFETFSVNETSIQLCRSLGFHEIARIPKSSVIAEYGLADNGVFLQEFEENIGETLPSFGETDDYVTEYDKKFSNVNNRLDYLPYFCETRSGYQLCIDYMKLEEMPILFELLTTCVKSGRGYTQSDIEDVEDLVESVIADSGYTCLGIYPQNDDDNVGPIGTMVFCANRWVRSFTAELADVWIVLKPEYEGRGIGALVSKFWASLAGDLGYSGLLVDVFCNNTGMIKILQHKLGYREVGCLPKCGFLSGSGWTDAVLFYTDTTPGQM